MRVREGDADLPAAVLEDEYVRHFRPAGQLGVSVGPHVYQVTDVGWRQRCEGRAGARAAPPVAPGRGHRGWVAAAHRRSSNRGSGCWGGYVWSCARGEFIGGRRRGGKSEAAEKRGKAAIRGER